MLAYISDNRLIVKFKIASLRMYGEHAAPKKSNEFAATPIPTMALLVHEKL